MPLAAGARLGPYEIESAIGAEGRSKIDRNHGFRSRTRPDARAWFTPQSAAQPMARDPLGLGVAGVSSAYEPRNPSSSTLHQIGLEHFETFRAQAASPG